MSNFDIKKFLAENKLTSASKLKEEITPVDKKRISNTLKDLIKLLQNSDNMEGFIDVAVSRLSSIKGDNISESSERDDRMEGLVNIKVYNAFIKASRNLVQDLKNEGFDDEDIHSFLLRRIKSQKYIAENNNTSVKLSKILLEQHDVRTILKELDSYAAEFEDKLYTYSDKDLTSTLNKLERLLPSSATDSETLLQNIADFVDDILGVGDEMVYIFDTLEKLHDLELFDFYSEFENIVRKLIEHIKENVMYDRIHSASGVD